jgi:hypothetical protein
MTRHNDDGTTTAGIKIAGMEHTMVMVMEGNKREAAAPGNNEQLRGRANLHRKAEADFAIGCKSLCT